MSLWVTSVLVPVVITLIGVAGKDLIAALFGRRKTRADAEAARADAAAVMADTAVELVEPIRRELTAVRQEVREIADYVQRLHDAIFDPGAALDTVREFVRTNGRMRR